MDPAANLREQIELAEGIIGKIDGRDEDELDEVPTDFLKDLVDDAERLAELVLALDQWIIRGGFLPARWRP